MEIRNSVMVILVLFSFLSACKPLNNDVGSIATTLRTGQPYTWDGVDAVIKQNQSLSLRVSPSVGVEIDTFRWFLDGDKLADGPSALTQTFGPGLNTGSHTISLIVKADGLLWSESINIFVEY